ncbi:MAG: hypothetical protein MI757_04695, partial [Pirellulales bacterium]|nr:hypothetical protein [Pirellulales bacterium]
IAKLAGQELTPRGKIDGLEASATIQGDAESPREELLFYSARGNLEGLRHGDWKLRTAGSQVELFNLADDIGETKNLAKELPEKVAELKAHMQKLHADVVANVRPHGKLAKVKKAE